MRTPFPRPALALLPLLAGCGFGLQQFGLDSGGGDDGLLDYVPDTGGEGGDGGGSTGDGGGSSTGDGGGSGTGDGGGSGTGDGGGSGSADHAPTLENLNVSEGADRIEVSFQAADVDDDLNGGVLRLVVNGDTLNLDIPSDVSDWRTSGTSTHYLDLDPCEGGSTISVQATLYDAAGNTSPTRSDSMLQSGVAYNLTERGDAGTTDLENLGEISRGTVLCGNMDAASNDGSSYTGDLDFVKFSPTSTGNLTFVLTWEASSGDYNLSMFDTGYTTWLGDSSTPGTAQPERFTYNASAAQSYILRIAGASGGTGDYMVQID